MIDVETFYKYLKIIKCFDDWLRPLGRLVAASRGCMICPIGAYPSLPKGGKEGEFGQPEYAFAGYILGTPQSCLNLDYSDYAEGITTPKDYYDY